MRQIVDERPDSVADLRAEIERRRRELEEIEAALTRWEQAADAVAKREDADFTTVSGREPG